MAALSIDGVRHTLERPEAGVAVQFIESSVVGLRAAVITLRNNSTPLRFILFPMVHVAEPAFYDEVAARVRQCQLIVAEGAPSGFAPAQEWMAQHRHRLGHVVDQAAALRLDTLGVPVRWEMTQAPKTRRDQLITRAVDSAGAATIGLLRKFMDPLGVPSVDQADEYDASTESQAGGWFERTIEYNVRTVRDGNLVREIGQIHADHHTETMTVAVVYGGAHMPALADHLCGKLRYIAASAEWLTVASARS